MSDARRGPLVVGALTVFTGGGRSAPAHPPRGTLVLGPDVGAFLVHSFFWLFAIPLDVIAIVGWFFALRALVRRRPS